MHVRIDEPGDHAASLKVDDLHRHAGGRVDARCDARHPLPGDEHVLKPPRLGGVEVGVAQKDQHSEAT
jgi:hypothetical protein